MKQGMHNAKFDKKATGGIHKEQFREYEHKEYGNYVNESLTHENVYQGNSDWNSSIQRALEITAETTGKKVRDNVVVVNSMVETVPSSWPKEAVIEYFERQDNMLKELYQEQGVNVNEWYLSSVIHFDETNPHRTFTIIPMQTQEDGSEKLCNKQVVNQYFLQQSSFRGWDVYQEFAQEHPELEQMEEPDRTNKREHLNDLEYKIEQTERELEYKQQQSQELEQQQEQQRQQQQMELEQQQQQQMELQQALEGLQRMVEEHERNIEQYEKVETQVQHWFDSYHVVQQVHEIEPIQLREPQTVSLHENMNPFSQTHDYVPKEEYDKAIELAKEQVKEANNAIRQANQAITAVNEDNKHNYEVERANTSLKARNEALEAEIAKYEHEDVNALNKSLTQENEALRAENEQILQSKEQLEQQCSALIDHTVKQEQQLEQQQHEINHLSNVLEKVVNFLDNYIQPMVNFPVIGKMLEVFTSKEKETIENHRDIDNVEEREIDSYDRGYER